MLVYQRVYPRQDSIKASILGPLGPLGPLGWVVRQVTAYLLRDSASPYALDAWRAKRIMMFPCVFWRSKITTLGAYHGISGISHFHTNSCDNLPSLAINVMNWGMPSPHFTHFYTNHFGVSNQKPCKTARVCRFERAVISTQSLGYSRVWLEKLSLPLSKHPHCLWCFQSSPSQISNPYHPYPPRPITIHTCHTSKLIILHRQTHLGVLQKVAEIL